MGKRRSRAGMTGAVPLNELGRRIGQWHHRAVLSDHDVDLVHALHDDGMSMAEIARKFEVSKGCIWKIVHGYRRSQVAARWMRVRVIEDVE